MKRIAIVAMLAVTAPLHAQGLMDDVAQLKANMAAITSMQTAMKAQMDNLQADAANSGKLLVVFVGGLTPREIKGVITCSLPSFGEDSTPRIVAVRMTVDGPMQRRLNTGAWSLREMASDAEIRQAVGLEVSQSAVPFVEPGSQTPPVRPDGDEAIGSLPTWPDILKGMEHYSPTKYTQRIYNLGERTDQVSRYVTEEKWHQSGGMLGVKGFTSTLYKYVPSDAENRVGRILVANGLPYGGQWEVGLVRKYPNGTRFVDRLKNADGKDFEVRTRFKKNGTWHSKVVFADHAARPSGYNGLTQSCSSCHDDAGSGDYGAGLVPGGDTIISDPLDWSLLTGLTQDARRRIRIN